MLTRDWPVALAVVGFGLLGAVGLAALWRFDNSARVQTQIAYTRFTARAEPGVEVVIIGDSVAKLSAPATLCGLRVRDYSQGGSSAWQWTRAAGAIVRTTKPRVAVIALGVNDAYIRNREDYARWERTYDRLVGEVRAPTVVLVAPLPVQPFGKGPRFSNAFIERQQEHIGSLAGDRYRVAPAVSTVGLVRPDGVHPNEAGEQAWARRLADVACPA
jgi:hypothetical protein